MLHRALPRTQKRIMRQFVELRHTGSRISAGVCSLSSAPQDSLSGLRIGLVGLPNAGKSTVFNALTSSERAQVGPYPFCTIDPNISRVSVVDKTLDRLAERVGAVRKVPSQVEVVDIAGLVSGASRGAGLGARFLHNIRGVDCIAHVVRKFSNEIVEETGSGSAISDILTIETELCLSDLAQVERRQEKLASQRRVARAAVDAENALLEEAAAILTEGSPVRTSSPALVQGLQHLGLLTAKPLLICFNVDDDLFRIACEGREDHLAGLVPKSMGEYSRVIVSAALESSLALMPRDEAEDMLDALEFPKDSAEECGAWRVGMEQLVRSGFDACGRHVFYTAGEKEARSWTIRRGAAAPEAARAIHSDMERGFICAEVAHVDDVLEVRCALCRRLIATTLP